MKLNWAECHVEKKKKTEAENPVGWYFFFFFFIFSICRFFVSLEMFTIHVLRSYEKNGMDISKSGREYGSQSYVFALLVSQIYFSDIYIDAKYK